MGVKSIMRAMGLKKLTSLLNFNYSVTINGKKFTVPIIKNLGLLNLSIKQDWFFSVLKLLNLPKDSSFIDIGVNVGQTLLTFRSHYDSPYWGFEPNPNCVFYLNTLIKANQFRSTHIVPVGLSSDNMVAKFYLKNEVDAAGTTVQGLRPDYYEEEEISYVPLFSLDKLDTKAMGAISLIKIDVEGAELEVVSGMVETLKKHKPIIICEILDYHSEKSKQETQQRADRLTQLIQSLNYSVFKIVNDKGNATIHKISKVELKLWVADSWDINDYLFVPQEKVSSLPLNIGK